MKIYLSGPMSGLPNLNREAFETETQRLRTSGHVVLNPHEMACGLNAGWSWGQWITWDLDVLRTVHFDCVALLPDWEKSPGAQIERIFAERLGIKILNAEDIR